MPDFHAKLTHRFRKQQEFAQTYSPLYARIFGLVADLLAADDDDPLVVWLVDAADGRSPLDITLLLLAGLHRNVLNNTPEAADLAQYYPTVGGKRPFTDSQFPRALRQTILARRQALTPFIQTATVQTNETARGIAWLLPLLYTGWEAVHLVDLGASAGLNLTAEARNYRLINDVEHSDIGNGQPVQFQMQSHGAFQQPPDANSQPQIVSRTGCDLAPFRLNSPADEQALAAYIWADQPHRLRRLREGIAAFHQANQGRAPIRLYPVRLPDDLPRFLRQHVPVKPDLPVVIYNTYMTVYLDDNGRALRQQIADWALSQDRPVLWLQWEPLWDGPDPPEYGWVGWTADYWHRSQHRHWLLAWNHPHGIDIQWQPGLRHWGDYWKSNAN